MTTSTPGTTQTTSRRTTWIITAAGLLCLALFLAFYDQAFPSAAIDLDRSRAQIRAEAERYVADRGHDVSDYKFALTFTENGWGSIYLQRALGVAETNRLLQRRDLPLWYWRARWFKPLQKEGFDVYIAPDGEVVEFVHTLLEDAPGASLDQATARAQAERYLTEDRGWTLADWENVTAASTDRPGGRTDHTFEWKLRAWDVGESELRLTVIIQGDEIGHYEYWLKTPESFRRDFSNQQSVASFISSISLTLGLLLFFITTVLIVQMTHSNIISALTPAIYPAGALALIMLLNGLNQLPLVKASYSTTISYTLFWVGQALMVIFLPIIGGMSVFGLWCWGHWLSKQVWPRQDRILARRGNRWRTLAHSSWRGLMLGAMQAGYLVIFYLIATRLFGSWTPMTPDYTTAYATPLPFLGALQSGLFPALWEELMFRLVGIASVLWLLRTFTRWPRSIRRALALLIPGAVWGFAHLSYIRDPLYLRGIELTLAAVFLEGLFFLHFDLTTAIVAHFAYNAGLTALPLLRSGDPYFVASGVVVVGAMLAPVIAGLLLGRREQAQRPRPHICPAEPEDAGALAALADESEHETLAAWLSAPDAAGLSLVAGEEIIGGALAQIEESEESTESTAEIVWVCVAPAWRRRYWG
ncbi:MAG: CPBP family intramembrane glutamic endopeptidase, partial [Anaerolineales bacterium]